MSEISTLMVKPLIFIWLSLTIPLNEHLLRFYLPLHFLLCELLTFSHIFLWIILFSSYIPGWRLHIKYMYTLLFPSDVNLFLMCFSNMPNSYYCRGLHYYSLFLEDVDWWIPLLLQGLQSGTIRIYAGELSQTGQQDLFQTGTFPSFWKNQQLSSRYAEVEMPMRTQLCLPLSPLSPDLAQCLAHG